MLSMGSLKTKLCIVALPLYCLSAVQADRQSIPRRNFANRQGASTKAATYKGFQLWRQGLLPLSILCVRPERGSSLGSGRTSLNALQQMG